MRSGFDIHLHLFTPSDLHVMEDNPNQFSAQKKKIMPESMRNMIIPFLQRQPNITELDLSETGITTECIISLTEFLQTNKTITVLILNRNQLDDKAAIAIDFLLRCNQSLKTVNLKSNRISEVGAKALAEAIKHNNSLNYLNLGENPIGDEGGLALYEARELIARADLRLNIDEGYFPDKEICEIVKAVKIKLEYREGCALSFKNAESPITPSMIRNKLIPFLNFNAEIKTLLFDEARLNIEQINALVSLIQSYNAINLIWIDHNPPIGFKAIFALKEAAKQHTVSLKLPRHYKKINNNDDFFQRNKSKDRYVLDFGSSPMERFDSYMGISSQDIIDLIIPYLKDNSHITTLVLDRNRGITQGVIALANAETAITHLSLRGCYIQSEGIQALQKMNLLSLDIGGNYVMDNDLVMVVEGNTKLKSLKVNYREACMRQDMGGAQQFPQAIQAISTSLITTLSLQRHRIADEQIECLSTSKQIKSLNLSDNNLTDRSLTFLQNSPVAELNLALNPLFTDEGLQGYIAKNKTLVELCLYDVPSVGDLTAIELSQHPTLEKVSLGKYTNREKCKVSEAGIRLLAASPSLKEIHYNDEERFSRLLAEDNPVLRNSVSKEKAAVFSDMNESVVNTIFKVPSLFSITLFNFKKVAIKKIENQFLIHLCDYLDEYFEEEDAYKDGFMAINDMNPKTIYLARSVAFQVKRYRYQLIGGDGELKIGVILKNDLLIDCWEKEEEFMNNHSAIFSAELLRHIIHEGHISLFSQENELKLPEDIQEALVQRRIK